MPRLERTPVSIKLIFDPKEDTVRTAVALEDGAFIADLPGFLEHTDEVKCDDGIPRTCLLVTDNDVIVDMEGAAFPVANHIRRSFHFNCIVRLVRVNGEARVALYATRTKGPLSDEKSRRGIAISEGGELFLPFDGEIPYPIEKIEWKEKKRPKQRSPVVTRARSPAPPSEPEVPKPRRVSAHQRNSHKGNSVEGESRLTLLSGFLFDDIPTLPIVQLPDEEAVERYKNQKLHKERMRSRKGKPD